MTTPEDYFANFSTADDALVLASVSASKIPTIRGDTLRGLIPTIPTTRREFDAGDDIGVLDDQVANRR